ncbi:LacI family DNA-binding transcriptional regulator [Paracoccus sediminicola]|uniref:LacI family DNA-binding transcriptional regulator n=1 Tax=Paracoccus sediminicola TaxID=3017783 RepID=UPI0022F0C78B|nr:LacI family DNA-binding transcriptional regulator [Paracoccus sediminicola]WBU55712.1 LacI family DNA-binding transcriptional regulator [Paracoccus sediminicola]
MAAEKVTSQDVATLAGVSQSAVSRVFTPGASVSEAMAKKVRAAAEKLGYRPNVLARSLITGRTRIIGLVVAYLENQFYPVAIEHLSRALEAQGYHILIFMAENSDASVANVMQKLIDYQVDGIIAASVAMTNDLSDRCSNAGIPVVLFNRGQDGDQHSSVTSANRAGGAKVAEFLIAGGHQRIAHIAGWRGSSTGRDRKDGFLDALRAADREPVAVIDGMYQREAAADAARQMMALDSSPDAIFVGNDHMAFAVMEVLRQEMRLKLGEDISVVGYDDVPLAAWPSFDLTTVRQPVNRMISATVETMLSKIEHKNHTPRKIEIDGPLIQRGSARIPEGWTE